MGRKLAIAILDINLVGPSAVAATSRSISAWVFSTTFLCEALEKHPSKVLAVSLSLSRSPYEECTGRRYGEDFGDEDDIKNRVASSNSRLAGWRKILLYNGIWRDGKRMERMDVL